MHDLMPDEMAVQRMVMDTTRSIAMLYGFREVLMSLL